MAAKNGACRKRNGPKAAVYHYYRLWTAVALDDWRLLHTGSGAARHRAAPDPATHGAVPYCTAPDPVWTNLKESGRRRLEERTVVSGQWRSTSSTVGRLDLDVTSTKTWTLSGHRCHLPTSMSTCMASAAGKAYDSVATTAMTCRDGVWWLDVKATVIDQVSQRERYVCNSNTPQHSIIHSARKKISVYARIFCGEFSHFNGTRPHCINPSIYGYKRSVNCIYVRICLSVYLFVCLSVWTNPTNY